MRLLLPPLFCFLLSLQPTTAQAGTVQPSYYRPYLASRMKKAPTQKSTSNRTRLGIAAAAASAMLLVWWLRHPKGIEAQGPSKKKDHLAGKPREFNNLEYGYTGNEQVWLDQYGNLDVKSGQSLDDFELNPAFLLHTFIPEPPEILLENVGVSSITELLRIVYTKHHEESSATELGHIPYERILHFLANRLPNTPEQVLNSLRRERERGKNDLLYILVTLRERLFKEEKPEDTATALMILAPIFFEKHCHGHPRAAINQVLTLLGSPVIPMTVHGKTLHYLDNFKSECFNRCFVANKRTKGDVHERNGFFQILSPRVRFSGSALALNDANSTSYSFVKHLRAESTRKKIRDDFFERFNVESLVSTFKDSLYPTYRSPQDKKALKELSRAIKAIDLKKDNQEILKSIKCLASLKSLPGDINEEVKELVGAIGAPVEKECLERAIDILKKAANNEGDLQVWQIRDATKAVRGQNIEIRHAPVSQDFSDQLERQWPQLKKKGEWPEAIFDIMIGEYSDLFLAQYLRHIGVLKLKGKPY